MEDNKTPPNSLPNSWVKCNGMFMGEHGWGEDDMERSKGCCQRDYRPSFKKPGFGDSALDDTEDNELAREQGQFGHEDPEQPKDLSHLESSELKRHRRS